MTNISMNTGIEMFKKNIVEAIQLSQLPVGVVYYVLRDISSEMKDTYNNILQKEHNELLAQIKQEEEEKEDVKEHQE